MVTNRFSDLNVLAVFAHPDDEGFGSGGTLAMLSSLGASITLVCATNGDVGEISDPSLATPKNLWEVRQGELRRAMAVTGVSDIRFLNYRDSGMAGTADNEHPNSLHMAPDEVVVGQVAAVLREIEPDLVMTHDPTGGYGHPDHKAICRHTTRAWEEWRRDASGMGALYFAAFPRSFFHRMWQEMLDLGISPPFASMDVDSLGTPDGEVTTTVDVRAVVDTKIESLNCHQTQIDPNGPFAQLPEDKSREYMSTEFYCLAGAYRGEGWAETGGDILKGLAGEFGAG